MFDWEEAGEGVALHKSDSDMRTERPWFKNHRFRTEKREERKRENNQLMTYIVLHTSEEEKIIVGSVLV